MRAFDILLGILVAALWGGNYVASKFGIAHFSPFFFTALRYASVALMLLPFVPRPNVSQMKLIAMQAFALGVMHIALLVMSMQLGLGIASSAIVVQLGVPFSCLLGVFFLNDRIGRWRLGGMLVAFIGIAIVAGTPNISEHPLAFAVGVVSAFSWAVANLLVKRMGDISALQLSAWMGVFATPPLLLISALFDPNQWVLIPTASPVIWLSIVYSSVGSTVIAYTLWYYLLRKYQVTQVSPFSLLAPVFGTAFGQIFFAEHLSLQLILGGLVTIGGVAVIILRKPKIAVLGKDA